MTLKRVLNTSLLLIRFFLKERCPQLNAAPE